MKKKNRKAVVLLSGGIDSATTLAIAKSRGYELYALSFRYGQRHRVELRAARRVARKIGVEKHLVMNLDLRNIGGSALTDDWDVPKHSSVREIKKGIPVTYVPARNTIFLSLALAWAEVLGADDIFIGVNVLDYSGYPDCRSDFIRAFEKMARLATRAGVEHKRRIKIRTPLIKMSKAQIIRTGMKLGVDYGLTHSCYDPAASGLACGRCDSCLLRRKGFREAGLADPVKYKK